MTNMPEARLAREAELCYATLAMVTDYDCWRPGAVSVPDMLAVVGNNVEAVQRLIVRLLAEMPREHPPCPVGADRALEIALVTARGARDPAPRPQPAAIARRVLRSPS